MKAHTQSKLARARTKKQKIEQKLAEVELEIQQLVCEYKIYFMSMAHAQQYRDVNKLVDQSPYPCPICDGWHLSTKKERFKRRSKRMTHIVTVDKMPDAPCVVAGGRPKKVKIEVDRLIPILDEEIASNWDGEFLSDIVLNVSDMDLDVREEVARRYTLKLWTVSFANREKLMQLKPGPTAILQMFEKGLVSLDGQAIEHYRMLSEIEKKEHERLRGAEKELVEVVEK